MAVLSRSMLLVSIFRMFPLRPALFRAKDIIVTSFLFYLYILADYGYVELCYAHSAT